MNTVVKLKKPWKNAVEQISYSIGDGCPKKAVYDALGDALDYLPEIYGSRVLLATAPSADKRGSIILIDKTKDEGRWQGKIGLILKAGPSAFKYDPHNPSYPWDGPSPEVGDWVFFRFSDSYEVGVNGVSCRIIRDAHIVGKVTDVEVMW